MSKGKGDKIAVQVRLTPKMRDELINLGNEQGRDLSELIRESVYWLLLDYKIKKQKMTQGLELEQELKQTG